MAQPGSPHPLCFLDCGVECEPEIEPVKQCDDGRPSRSAGGRAGGQAGSKRRRSHSPGQRRRRHQPAAADPPDADPQVLAGWRARGEQHQLRSPGPYVGRKHGFFGVVYAGYNKFKLNRNGIQLQLENRVEAAVAGDVLLLWQLQKPAERPAPPRCPFFNFERSRLETDGLMAELSGIGSIPDFETWAKAKRESGWWAQMADAVLRPQAESGGGAPPAVRQLPPPAQQPRATQTAQRQQQQQQGQGVAAAQRRAMPPPLARPVVQAQPQQQQSQSQPQAQQQQQQQRHLQPETPQRRMFQLLKQCQQAGLKGSLVSDYMLEYRGQSEQQREMDMDMLLPYLEEFDQHLAAAPGGSSGDGVQRLPPGALSSLEIVAEVLAGVVRDGAGVASHMRRPPPQPSLTVEQRNARG